LTVGADSDVVLTPVGSANLTVPANPKDAPEDIAEARRIVVGGGNTAGLIITDGTLQVLPDAIFGSVVPIATNADGIDKEFGYLNVAEGGTLALTTDSNTGTVGNLYLDYLNGNGGDIGIPGPFNFKASGGAVTLGNRRIVGSAAGTKLVPEKGSSELVYVQNVKTLILESIELNVAAYSGIEIYAGSKVVLDKGAKIILVDGENGQATDWTNITTNSGTNSARLTGAFVGLYNPADATKQPVWSIAHKGGDLAEVNIIANGTISLGKAFKANFAR
jgi:hypothetical protein